MDAESDAKIHVGSAGKMSQNSNGPVEATVNTKRAVSVTEAQSLRYVTLKDIELDTGFLQRFWKKFTIKELLDNSWDWLNEVYPIPKNNKAIRKIAVRLGISKENESYFIHIAVRNSNVNNIAVFEDLDKIFDYGAWHGTKRLQRSTTTGALGDALKRCLGMGYALWTKDYDFNEFEDIQWHKPLIVRHNGEEFSVFIIVNTAISKIDKLIDKTGTTADNDTEVEVTLPIMLSEIEDCVEELRQYYKTYRIGKSGNITFSISEDIKNLEVE